MHLELFFLNILYGKIVNFQVQTKANLEVIKIVN